MSRRWQNKYCFDHLQHHSFQAHQSRLLSRQKAFFSQIISGRTEIAVGLLTVESPFDPGYCFGNQLFILQDIGQRNQAIELVRTRVPTGRHHPSQPFRGPITWG